MTAESPRHFKQHHGWILPVLAGSVALLAFWRVTTFSFFWEDPFDIGSASSYTNLQAVLIFYRPVTYFLHNLLNAGGGPYHPVPYQLFALTTHVLATVLLYVFVRDLFQKQGRAFATAVLFACFPPAIEAVRAASPHPLLVLLALGAAILYLQFRSGGKLILLLPAALLHLLALGTQENGVLIPGLLLLTELLLLAEKRTGKFTFWWLIFAAFSMAFFSYWASIPRDVIYVGSGLTLEKFLYLSQGVSYPLANLLQQFQLAWPADTVVITALVLSMGLLALIHWQRPLVLLFGLALWFGSILPAWYGLSIEYLDVSPRVMYFPMIAVAILWGGFGEIGRLADEGSPRLIGIAGFIVMVLLVAQSGIVLNREITLYRAGSDLMDQIVAYGEEAGPGQKVLFVNVPDRFADEDAPYPLGYWGMLLAPASQDLSDFIEFTSGVDVETRSAGAYAFIGEDFPYEVNPRGGFSYDPAGLYSDIQWADSAVTVMYDASGQMALIPLGRISNGQSGGTLNSYNDLVELRDMTLDTVTDRHIAVTLRWVSVEPLAPQDTVFVHILDSSGMVIAQQDGDSFMGMIPLTLWQPGDVLEEYRTIPLETSLPPGEYTLSVGLYNRASLDRIGEPYMMPLTLEDE